MFAAGEALIQNAGTKSKLTLVQRLKATVTKMLADIPEEKRNGNSVRVMSSFSDDPTRVTNKWEDALGCGFNDPLRP
jgi:hypothetical protein